MPLSPTRYSRMGLIAKHRLWPDCSLSQQPPVSQCSTQRHTKYITAGLVTIQIF